MGVGFWDEKEGGGGTYLCWCLWVEEGESVVVVEVRKFVEKKARILWCFSIQVPRA